MADEGFTRRLVGRLLRAAERRVKSEIPSRTLRAALKRIVFDATHGALFIPHYWAIYVHDGRGPLGPRRGSFLIFFKDPLKDPRLRGGRFPERAAAVPRLTRSQFRAALKEFTDAQRTGRESDVVITRRVGGVTPTPFFSNEAGGGMFRFVDTANDVGQFEFRTFALGFLRKELGIRTFIPQLGQAGISIPPIKDRVVINLGRRL